MRINAMTVTENQDMWIKGSDHLPDGIYRINGGTIILLFNNHIDQPSQIKLPEYTPIERITKISKEQVTSVQRSNNETIKNLITSEKLFRDIMTSIH